MGAAVAKAAPAVPDRKRGALSAMNVLEVGAARRALRARTPDGVEIAIREWGNPEGPEILLLHGVGQCTLSFAAQIESELAREFRLVAADLRGHGDSDKPAEMRFYQEAQRWADEVATIIEAAGLRRPILVGWSMGGRVVGLYLLRYGDGRLGGVNFVSARVLPEADARGPDIFELPGGATADLAARIAANAAFVRACSATQPAPDEFAYTLAYNMAASPVAQTSLGGWPPLLEETRAALAGLRVPVLVTHGAADRVVLPIAGERTAAAVPGARLSLYEGCGHSPFREDAARFNRELADFARAAWAERTG